MLLLLDGPSASGKSTLVRGLLERFPQLHFCRRLTTRSPRPGEERESIRDYDFVSPEEFARRKNQGQLALYREFDFGMSYGLPRDPIDRALSRGQPVLALVDLGTAPQARDLWPDCTTALLCCPLAELEGRLRRRGQHSQEQIRERLDNARAVWDRVTEYDFVLINRDHDQGPATTLEQLSWIVQRALLRDSWCNCAQKLGDGICARDH